MISRLRLARVTPDCTTIGALALISLERYPEALAALERAAALAAGDFGVHFHRGVALALLERHDEALASFDRALELEPSSPEARPTEGWNSGILAGSRKRWPSSRNGGTPAGLHRSLQQRGEYAQRSGPISRGACDVRPGPRHRPNHPPTLWGKALLLLAMGKIEEGWPLYEARLRLEYLHEYRRAFAMPRWSGVEDLAGRSILIHAEQGLGDTLQFCRYLRLLEAAGARVVFEVQAQLAELMRSLGLRGPWSSGGSPCRKRTINVRC